MRVCVTYEEICPDSYYSGEQYGDWSESYSSSITGVYRLADEENGPYQSETFLIPDDATSVYVVYMIYDTGDSFGCAKGKISIIHATANEKAAYALAKKINENPDTYTIAITDDFGRNTSIYNPGNGLFKHISCVDVEKFDIGTGKPKTSAFKKPEGKYCIK